MLRYTQYRHSIGLGLVQYPIEFWHLNSIGFRFSGTWTSILYTSYSFEFCRKKWTDQILLDFYLVAWNWPQWRWWRRCTVQVLQPVPLVLCHGLLPTPLPCAKKDQHTLPHTEHRWYSSPRVSGRPRVGIDRPHEQQLCWREQQQMHRKPLSRNMLVRTVVKHTNSLTKAANMGKCHLPPRPPRYLAQHSYKLAVMVTRQLAAWCLGTWWGHCWHRRPTVSRSMPICYRMQRYWAPGAGQDGTHSSHCGWFGCLCQCVIVKEAIIEQQMPAPQLQSD